MTPEHIEKLETTLSNLYNESLQNWGAATNDIEENYYGGRVDAFQEVLSHLHNLCEQFRVTPPGGTE